MVMAGADSAMAVPATLDIDFRSAAWSDAQGQGTFAVGDVSATAVPQRRTLYQDSTDGLGVSSLSDLIFGSRDEINGRELLYIDFLNGSGNAINGVWITDLFPAPDGSTPQGEKGQLSLTLVGGGGEVVHSFFGIDSDPDGGQFISFGGALDLTKVIFEVPDPVFSLLSLSWPDDFSVAGFTRATAGGGTTPTTPGNSVPDGGAGVVLLGGALLCLGLLKRKA